MLSNNSRIALAVPLLLALGSCGGGGGEKPAKVSDLTPAAEIPADEANAKIGQPYEVKGESFNPADNTQYDEVGYGSWYGGDFEGKQTSNGEPYNPAGITAAHKTLPMPSYVEVTNLDTGKTILVRINDRGPFAGNRIIDLSQGAAQQLGVEGQGTYPVRVRRVNPPEEEKALLRQGKPAAERLDTTPALLAALRKHLPGAPGVVAAPAPKPITRPEVRPVEDVAPQVPSAGGDRFVIEDGRRPSTRPATAKPPVPKPNAAAPTVASGNWFVQIASFSSAERARAAASKSGGRVQNAGSVHRVVIGPYDSEESARTALRGMVAKGYRDARVTR